MPLPSCQSAGGKYQLLSKTTVKDEYLLTDRQLTAAQGGLGCLAVPNPNNPKHGDMKLYMRAQVEALALSTWHSEEALFDVKEKRREERLRKAEVKRKSKEEQPLREALVDASPCSRAGAVGSALWSPGGARTRP